MLALWIVAIVVAYGLGTFPSAQLVAGRRGVDPTSAGSGNPGATNVYRTAGRVAGALVLGADVAKGAVAAGAGWLLDGRPLGIACWVAATLGHIFPAGRRFRGGKGVATAGGGALVLFLLPALLCAAIFVAAARFSGRASVGSLTIAAALPVLVGVFGAPATETAASVALALVVILRHRDNIQRLLSGTETSYQQPR